MAWFVIINAILTFSKGLDTTYWGVFEEGKNVRFLQNVAESQNLNILLECPEFSR